MFARRDSRTGVPTENFVRVCIRRLTYNHGLPRNDAE